jgi:hypothetical protein
MEIGSSILASQLFLLDIKILPPVQSSPYLKMAIIASNPHIKGYFFAPWIRSPHAQQANLCSGRLPTANEAQSGP